MSLLRRSITSLVLLVRSLSLTRKRTRTGVVLRFSSSSKLRWTCLKSRLRRSSAAISTERAAVLILAVLCLAFAVGAALRAIDLGDTAICGEAVAGECFDGSSGERSLGAVLYGAAAFSLAAGFVVGMLTALRRWAPGPFVLLTAAGALLAVAAAVVGRT